MKNVIIRNIVKNSLRKRYPNLDLKRSKSSDGKMERQDFLRRSEKHRQKPGHSTEQSNSITKTQPGWPGESEERSIVKGDPESK